MYSDVCLEYQFRRNTLEFKDYAVYKFIIVYFALETSPKGVLYFTAKISIISWCVLLQNEIILYSFTRH